MKNKSKMFIIGTSLLITFSCNQEDNFIGENSFTQKSSLLISKNGDPYISGNPFDYVGASHNEFLDQHLSLHPELPGIGLSEVINLSVEFSLQNNFNAHDYITTQEIAGLLNTNIDQPFDNVINQLAQDGKISNVVYNKLLILGNVFKQATETKDLDILLQKIENLEKNYLELNLNEIDKTVLLSIISVARNSTNYWNNAYKAILQASLNNNLPKWANSTLTIISVISAGTIGAAKGAGTGAIIGGTNTSATIPGLAIVFATSTSGYVAFNNPV
ncbi:hypothetical protein [Chryseobacterium paridis]|uniref:Uncharacterized protein n=1 Tax=Chryseobacterium paridis TaxID=2800328 RepID=A0ABS1G0L5_9FLAO|nr:hypothetical protein [Chryseobacterium paridis]MBK1898239.1 hypothetical protein [Chryseobacterium paridis]